MKVLINESPFHRKDSNVDTRNLWDADWVTHPDARKDRSAVYGYTLAFNILKAQTIRIHVSADQRYILYVDGRRVGRGPEAGDFNNWFFESYELSLSAGSHRIAAETWWISEEDRPMVSRFFWQPAFLLAAEGVPSEMLNTGRANWQCTELGGYEIEQMATWHTGSRFSIHGDKYPWNWENGETGVLKCPKVLFPAGSGTFGQLGGVFYSKWRLRPAQLPAQHEAYASGFGVLHVEQVDTEDTSKQPVYRENCISEQIAKWDRLINDGDSLIVPPHSRLRVIVDLNDYYCAYPEVRLSGGRGGKVKISWAESLYEDESRGIKGHRSEIEGKIFTGTSDTYYPGGTEDEHYESLWWMSGRFLELYVETADQLLTIHSIRILETHYPFDLQQTLNCSDPNLLGFVPIAERSLCMCAHETYMDCPYYEQLMYAGDTRLEMLVTYTLTQDARLPAKAIDIFDKSRMPSGLTQSRYPSYLTQCIPPFSLWYVAMVYDYAMWRNDPEMITAVMPGVRGILEHFRNLIGKDGLLRAADGWNFSDWVPGWTCGMAPDSDTGGISGLLCMQLIYTLSLAEKLEQMQGEPELAKRNRRLMESLRSAVLEHFWDEERGMFSDNLDRSLWSEHTQCLAVLSECFGGDRVGRMMDAIASRTDVARTTIYFSHYLLEACGKADRMDMFMQKLEFWNNLGNMGFKTTPESPEPSRSDCHAWGSHPLYHIVTGILGIRPDAPGFSRVLVHPHLCNLDWVSGRVPHQLGMIEAEFENKGGRLSGRIVLPPGLTGTASLNDDVIILHEGDNRID